MNIELEKIDMFDYLDILIKDNVKADLILCDLPYGTTKCKWDTPIDLNLFWEKIKKVIKPNTAIVLYGQTPFDKVLGVSNLKMLKYEWIWEKTQATGHLNAKKMPLKAHENILVFYNKPPIYNFQKTTGHKPVNGYTKYVKTQNKTEIYNEVKKEISGGGNTDRFPRSVLKFKSDKQKECYHSTQKPIALSDYLVKTYSNENNLVIDICYGSGTTAVSCKKLNRKFKGTDNGICEKKGDFYKKSWKEVTEFRLNKI